MQACWSVVALAALALAPGAVADTLVHADPTAENVTAYGGTLMWSRRDAAGRYHLVQRVGAVVSDAPVASASTAFDPDLGPAGRRRRPSAVYERCRGGPLRCDAFRLDVMSGRERRVRSVSTRAGSEFGVSTWAGRYAFVREGPRREGLFMATGRSRFLSGRPVVETDLRGRTIGVATYSAGGRLQVDHTGIYVHRLARRGRGRSCLVARGSQGGEQGTALDSPVLDGRHLYWHEFTATPGIVERIARAAVPSGCSRPPAVERSDRTLPVGVDSIAVDRGSVYYTQADYVDATGVYLADAPPPHFGG